MKADKRDSTAERFPRADRSICRREETIQIQIKREKCSGKFPISYDFETEAHRRSEVLRLVGRLLLSSSVAGRRPFLSKGKYSLGLDIVCDKSFECLRLFSQTGKSLTERERERERGGRQLPTDKIFAFLAYTRLQKR